MIHTGLTGCFLKLKEMLPNDMFDVNSFVVKRRRLHATYSLQSAQNLNAMHGTDIEKLLVNKLAKEIQEQIDREILNSIIGI